MIYQVQYLRAIAVLSVVYFHLVEVLNDNGAHIDGVLHELGPVGVDLFFVISGFIMARIVAQTNIDPLRFMLARLRRIAPLYWLATLLLFAIAAYFPSLLTKTTANPVQLLHSLLFIPNGQSTVSDAPILVIGWTLNYEMFFYGLVAFCAGALGDKKLHMVLITLVALTLVGWLVTINNGYMDFYTDSIILEFGFGILVHHYYGRQCKKKTPKFYVFAIIAMSAMIVFAKDYYLSEMRPFIWGIPSAVIVYCALRLNFGTETVFKKIGDWSYGIYIWHVFAIVAIVKFSIGGSALNYFDILTVFSYLAMAMTAVIFICLGINKFSWRNSDKIPGIDTDNSKCWREL